MEGGVVQFPYRIRILPTAHRLFAPLWNMFITVASYFLFPDRSKNCIATAVIGRNFLFPDRNKNCIVTAVIGRKRSQ